jgi:hypothetical protein
MYNEDAIKFIEKLKTELIKSSIFPDETLKVYKNSPYRIGYLINRVYWQCNIYQSSVVVKIYFYGPENVEKYNTILSTKKITNHYFGDIIESTGNKGGKSISIQIKVSGGYLNKPDWDDICKKCIKSMKILYAEFYTVLKSM